MKKLNYHIDIRILEKAKVLERITKHLYKYAGKNSNCYACNIVENMLVLGATNSSNLSIIRNYQRDILKDINYEFGEVLKLKLTKIKFKIIKDPEI
jgi:hypothetical protein|tara:strand:+ start:561 stop:848 length:288 start_codon:yes stop_codon:yes gene_type:complete